MSCERTYLTGGIVVDYEPAWQFNKHATIWFQKPSGHKMAFCIPLPSVRSYANQIMQKRSDSISEINREFENYILNKTIVIATTYHKPRGWFQKHLSTGVAFL